MRLLFFTILLLILNVCQAQNRIIGTISGLSQAGVNKIFIYHAEQGGALVDSALVVNDRFKFELGIKPAKLYSLGFREKNIGMILWLDNSNIKIASTISQMIIDTKRIKLQRLFSGVSVTGSITQDLHNRLLKRIYPLLEEHYYNRPKGEALFAEGEGPITNKAKITEEIRKFIEDNGNSPVSSFLLFHFGKYDGILPNSLSDDLYNKLTEDNKNSYFGKLYKSWQ